MRLLVIIPAYNEEANIERTVQNLKQYMNAEWDFVVVNDGSKDKTAQICREKKFPLLDLPVNLGLAGAFQAGLKYAKEKDFDYVLQFDGDGQHRPEYIKPMLLAMQENQLDIMIGSRFVNQKKPKTLRMLGSNLISAAIKITTGQKLKDPTSGMRMFNRKMISEFGSNLNYGPEPDTIAYVIKNGATVQEFQVSMDERIAGESYLNLARSIRYMLNMFVSILFVQSFRPKR